MGGSRTLHIVYGLLGHMQTAGVRLSVTDLQPLVVALTHDDARLAAAEALLLGQDSSHGSARDPPRAFFYALVLAHAYRSSETEVSRLLAACPIQPGLEYYHFLISLYTILRSPGSVLAVAVRLAEDGLPLVAETHRLLLPGLLASLEPADLRAARDHLASPPGIFGGLAKDVFQVHGLAADLEKLLREKETTLRGMMELEKTFGVAGGGGGGGGEGGGEGESGEKETMSTYAGDLGQALAILEEIRANMLTWKERSLSVLQ
jgi:hypothetical protein